MTAKFDNFVKMIMGGPSPERQRARPLALYVSYADRVSLAKALEPKVAKAPKTVAASREVPARNNVIDRRALTAEFNAWATRLAKSGEMTAEQGSLADALLHRFAVGL